MRVRGHLREGPRSELRILSVHLPHSAFNEEAWQARVSDINEEMWGSTFLAGDINQEFHCEMDDGLVQVEFRGEGPTSQRSGILRSIIENMNLVVTSSEVAWILEEDEQRLQEWAHRNFASGRLFRLGHICAPRSWKVHSRCH